MEKIISRFCKKPDAYLQTMIKVSVKFQKDRYKTVGGFALTMFPLQTRNHAKRKV